MESVDVGAVQEPIGDTPEVAVFQDGERAVVLVVHGPWVEAAVVQDGVVRKHVQRWEIAGEAVTRAVEVV